MKPPIPLMELYLRENKYNNSPVRWTNKLTPDEWFNYQTYLRTKFESEGVKKLWIMSRMKNVIRNIQNDYHNMVLNYNEMIKSKGMFNKVRNGK